MELCRRLGLIYNYRLKGIEAQIKMFLGCKFLNNIFFISS